MSDDIERAETRAKRDDDTPRSKPHVERHARRLRKLQETKHARSFNAIMAKAEADGNETDRRKDGGVNVGSSDHRASKVADLLVEAGTHPDRSAALDYLMHSSRGAALLHRMSKKETTPMESIEKLKAARVEKLEQLAKSSGVVAVAKHELAKGTSDLTPADFNRMCNADWQRDRRSNESYDQCFTRHYVSPENRDVRKVDQMLKSMPLNVTPGMVGGVSATHEAVNNTEQSEAYQQLVDKAEELRASSPFLSTSQAFARAGELRPDLLAKAHVRPTAPAGGMYPYPR